MASTDARPVPIKNTAYRVYFPIYDADGDTVTGATGLDSEVSKDGAAFADLGDEAHEIGTSGIYYLDLTNTEMNADSVVVRVQTTSVGAKTSVIMLYPQETGDIKVDVTSYNGTAGTFAAGRPEVNVSHFGGTAGTFAAGIPTAALSSGALTGVANSVWDEPSASHVAAGSFGSALYVVRSNTAQAGSGTTITLDASASATNDFYKDQNIYIVAGTGIGQGRFITSYVGATKVATVSSWAVNPDNTSRFVILPYGSIPGASAPTAAQNAAAVWDEAVAGHTTSGTYGQYVGGTVLQTGTAQAGTTSSITLAAGASSTDSRYNRNQIVIISGTGFGQSSQITAYVGSTRVATVAPAFLIAPDNTSVYIVAPLGIDAATIAAVAAAVWDEQRANHAAAGSFGEYTNADVLRLSGDAGAADNAESFFDGTGYAGTNNVIPLVTACTTVTTVSGNVNGSVASVTGAVGSVTGAVGSVTGAVGSVTGNVGGNVVGSVASVTGNVGGNVTGNVTGNIGGSVNSLNTQAKADVRAEVVAALITDTYAQPAAVPAATCSLKDKINWVFTVQRNKVTQTATTQLVRNDTDAGTIGTSTVSDDATTAVRGKYV